MTETREFSGWMVAPLGGNHVPYIDHHADDPEELRAPKRVVALGLVAGIPWTITAYETKNDLMGHEDRRSHDFRKVLDLFLGHAGRYGGMSIYSEVPDDESLLVTAVHRCGDPGPRLAILLGVAASSVSEVRFQENERLAQPVHLLEPGNEHPRCFVLASPLPARRLTLEAIDSGNRTAQTVLPPLGRR